MGKLSTTIVQDGGKNATIQVSGMLDPKPALQEILVFSALQNVRRVRIDACIFAIQEKAGVHFWWMVEDKRQYAFTLESRGRFDFEALQGIQSPEGCKGIAVSFFNCEEPKGVFLLLDMNKA